MCNLVVMTQKKKKEIIVSKEGVRSGMILYERRDLVSNDDPGRQG